MSLIPLAAHLIRLAATDDGYAQDLYDAVYYAVNKEEDPTAGLVEAPIQEYERSYLTSTEWQWYASWRQAQGGKLDSVVLDHLTASASTRFARFKVRELVLRDPRTNELAGERNNPPDGPDAIGLNWLSEQAKGARVDETFKERARRALSDELPEEWTRLGQTSELFAERVPWSKIFDAGFGAEATWSEILGEDFQERLRRAKDDEAIELTRDALQCATKASWFLLRQLTSLDDVERRRLVNDLLGKFATERGLGREFTNQWYGFGEPVGG
jgi:hypothetical protein